MVNSFALMPRTRNRIEQKEFRQELRSHGTTTEAMLWSELKGRKLKGRKFRRQAGFGRYVADLYCPDEQLVVEVDGSAHQMPGAEYHDEIRDAFLKSLGVRVLRFDNKDVLDDLDAVLDEIARHFTEPGQQRTDRRTARRSALTHSRSRGEQ